MRRRYYSQRIRDNGESASKLTLEKMKSFFEIIYKEFYNKKYFCEKFDLGCCVDCSDNNLSNALLKSVRKDLWPICDIYEDEGKLKEYDKDDLFDIIEFLFDGISKPIKDDNDHYHSWGECGYHYSKYSTEDGRNEFRKEINEFLYDFEEGYELSEKGEVQYKIDKGVGRLLKAKKIDLGKKGLKNRMIQAEELFYNGKSSLLDRKNAVKELSDCFEYLREDVRNVLDKKDESDLFNILNNFEIRHCNEKQKNNYDKNIWLSWMFHFYLASLHACLRLMEKNHEKLNKEENE